MKLLYPSEGLNQKINKKELEEKINSFQTLISWIKKDLRYYNSKKIPLENLKSLLKDILNVVDFTESIHHKKIREKILQALEYQGNDFLKILEEIYLSSFFSKEVYFQKLETLQNSNTQDVMNARAELLDYPQTLAFAIFFADQEKKLNQIDRATLWIKAFLKFLLNTDLGDQYSNYLFRSSFCFIEKNQKEQVLINKAPAYVIILLEGYYYRLDVLKNGKPISADSIRIGLEGILKDVKGRSIPTFPFSAVSRKNRCRIREKYSKVGDPFFREIEGSLFTICLDLAPYGKNMPEEVFSHRFKNRHFGNTQIIVGAKGESAAIVNYAKIDGIPAINLFKTIYRDSQTLEDWGDSKDEISLKKINFPTEEKDKDALQFEKDVEKILHFEKSSFALNISTAFFKKMNLSPNIALNFLLMLGTYDLIKDYPVVNHALSRLDSQFPACQLDWVYISPKDIEKFHKGVLNHAELFSYHSCNKKTALLNQRKTNESNTVGINELNTISRDSEIENKALLHRAFLFNQGYESHLMQLKFLFQNAVSNHLDKIRLAKEGLSPTFLFQKPEGDFFQKLVNFYLDFGKYAPAYRNYLFRAHRNPQSIDVMTSSLKLPFEIKTLGRHGSCSDVFSCYGLHILFKEGFIELVFIPNKNFVGKMQEVVERIERWFFIIKTIFG